MSNRPTIPSGSTFIPAIGPQYMSFWKRGDHYAGHDYKWFTDESYFQWGSALISAYFGMEDKDYRKKAGFPEDRLLIGDSGGFQIASFRRRGKPINIRPLDVLRWQEANCDIGMNLDVPVAFGNFEKCLEESLVNFKVFETFRQTDMPLYNVLHGRTVDEIKTWYEAVKNFDFQGWAIGIKGSLYMQIYGYLYLRDQNAQGLPFGVHLFGMSSIDRMLAMSLLSKRFGQPTTYDSSSYSMGARDRRFYHSLSVRYFSEFRRESSKTLKAIPCECPVCRTLTIDQYYSQTETSAPILLSLHDLYQYITLSRFIDIIIEDPEVFYDYSRSYGESDTMKNLNGIFDSFENGGITQVELDFGHLLDFNGNKVTRAQTGLMGHSRRNGPSAINMKDILPENYIPSEEECIYGR